jgi:phospholipase C
MMIDLSLVDTIVIVMMENRSFDHLEFEDHSTRPLETGEK